MGHWTYLIIDLGAVLIPFIFSFHPKIKFNKQFKAFVLSSTLIAIPFILWDVFFTSKGYWGFNSNYLVNLHVFLLPIEEWLFFILIPFACTFSYHTLSKHVDFEPHKKWTDIVFYGVALCAIYGAFHFSLPYTLWTSIALLIFLVALMNHPNKTAIIAVYLIMLIPFFIVNGLLTGTGLESPVVWYSPQAFLGYRMLSIPLEDAFYGFVLIGSNFMLYDYFRSRLSA